MSTKLAVHIPGQGIRIEPDVESLKSSSELAPIVDATFNAFSQAVVSELGTNAPAEIMQADRATLEQNTLFAQLRFFYKSSAMWMALMKASFNDEPTLEQLVGDGKIQIQLSGHSLGAAISWYLPGPGHLDDQLANISSGTKSIGRRALPMLNTPGDYSEGGMAAISGLWGWHVNRLVKRTNDRLGHEGAIQVVTHNAPKLKVVAGPREGLEMIGSYVKTAKGLFFDRLSPRWYHHNWVMRQPAYAYGRFLDETGALGNPYPLFRHVSYVSGTEVSISGQKQDLIDGVWWPVHYFTFRGPSVHGATYKSGFRNVVVWAKELVNWLDYSNNVRPHFARDLAGLAVVKEELMNVVDGTVHAGKLKAIQPTPSLQVQHDTPYLAQR